MDDRTWETPELDALTDAELRADRADITMANGNGPFPTF